VNTEILLVSSILLITIIISLYLIRMTMRFYRKKKSLKEKDSSQVGFVVDTFHDLVSQLKEKERELEVLRKKAEDRATAIEGYNENILQSVPSGVISFDEEMRITKLNLAAERILELERETTAGKHQSEVLEKPITDYLSRKELIERGEIAYITPSGRRIWLGLAITPLKDGTGSTIGQLLVFTDLTHLKAIESQMALRDKLSSLGEISAGIAHELRNPMAVIAGYTKLLSKKAESTLQPPVEAIAKEIAVMDRIISDFLSFAKPAELTLSALTIKAIIDQCVASVTDERNDITAVVAVDGSFSVRGDEVFLRQAFINLLQNAAESMPRGGSLTVKSSPSRGTQGFLDISISDTGHGISDDVKNKIFLPFFTTKEKGTGLGLAIVQKIIVSHGGNVSVESSDKGTTFTVRLPLGK
jgi:two-component system sensor histidine kinase PilS (NtrC family)